VEMLSYKNYNQSFLIEENDKAMLIDCGTRVPIALHEQGIDVNKITDIYISHAHGDHCGGLEEVAFLRYDWVGRPTKHDDGKRSKDYAPRLIANEVLLRDLWKHSLSGGLRSMEGFDASLETYFKPVPVKANQKFVWEGWECSLVQQIHVMTGSVIMNTFGLFMENKETKRTVFFTTDAQYFQPEQVKIFYDKAELIFQDTEVTGVDTKNKKLVFKSGVHASYAQLAGWDSVNAFKLDEKTKSKLWLSHYQDCVNVNKDFFGNDCDWEKQAKEDGFAGFVKVGQEFLIV
jgi:ribonuclease BN (tRNA processing enzyme)